MTISIYKALPGDRAELQHIDMKCYDYPIDFEDWGVMLAQNPIGETIPNTCVVVRKDEKIAGYYIYSGTPTEDRDLMVSRIGVARDVRKKGLGAFLLRDALKRAKSSGLRGVQLRIPEYFTDADEFERGVSEFIISTGLVLHKTERAAFFHYGRHYDANIYRWDGTTLVTA